MVTEKSTAKSGEMYSVTIVKLQGEPNAEGLGTKCI